MAKIRKVESGLSGGANVAYGHADPGNKSYCPGETRNWNDFRRELEPFGPDCLVGFRVVHRASLGYQNTAEARHMQEADGIINFYPSMTGAVCGKSCPVSRPNLLLSKNYAGFGQSHLVAAFRRLLRNGDKRVRPAQSSAGGQYLDLLMECG